MLFFYFIFYFFFFFCTFLASPTVIIKAVVLVGMQKSNILPPSLSVSMHVHLVSLIIIFRMEKLFFVFVALKCLFTLLFTPVISRKGGLELSVQDSFVSLFLFFN